ncbi:MAG: hypothetical protein WBO29_00930, partial [Albidovulum sp.]
MAKAIKFDPTPRPVRIDRVFLDLENPRHEPYNTQADAIEYLCRKENVIQLARDIVKLGLNPLEMFALIPSKNAPNSYIATEGNRRMCAIKLLHDSDLAPPDLRKEFEQLAGAWTTKIVSILGVVFASRDEVAIWLERTHGGEQGGVGRRRWNAEQKTRHIGDKRNETAQAVLDYAESKGLISAKQREGKLTTVQRFTGNSTFREAIGIENVGPDGINLTRPEEDVDLLLGRFLRDLDIGKDGPVTSRKNSDQVKAYARDLSNIPGQQGTRVAPTPAVKPLPKSHRAKAPKRPAKPNRIQFEQTIYDKLFMLGSYKLQRLYYSICDISLQEHTPLLTVGVWSFLESLTGLAGRDENTDFYGFFSNQR